MNDSYFDIDGRFLLVVSSDHDGTHPRFNVEIEAVDCKTGHVSNIVQMNYMLSYLDGYLLAGPKDEEDILVMNMQQYSTLLLALSKIDPGKTVVALLEDQREGEWVRVFKGELLNKPCMALEEDYCESEDDVYFALVIYPPENKEHSVSAVLFRSDSAISDMESDEFDGFVLECEQEARKWGVELEVRVKRGDYFLDDYDDDDEEGGEQWE